VWEILFGARKVGEDEMAVDCDPAVFEGAAPPLVFSLYDEYHVT
jgi:hypothetical protein